MDWNAKWDWENLAMFSPKACLSPKRQQSTDWGIEEVEEIDALSFNLSGESVGSGSELGHASSVKSSISASIYSSWKERVKTSNFTPEIFDGHGDVFCKKKELTRAEPTGSSPVLASVGSGESLIGLKLGKRTYFENGPSNNNKASTFPMIPDSTAIASKKIKSSCHSTPVARCQVEGCNLDLSSAKGYHRKHKVCENHSKSPRVIIGGLERRFCQQCSRFHSLTEFDEKKRSCRRRLSDHNARRRKPQQETFQFQSAGFSSPFHAGGRKMNFLLNNNSLVHARPAVSLPWDTCGSKFTITNGSHMKPEKAGVINDQSTVAVMQHLHATGIHEPSKIIRAKLNTTDTLNPGFKDSPATLNSDVALDFGRALSLLSSTSWGSCEPEFITFGDYPMHISDTSIPLQGMDAIPQGLHHASSSYGQAK